MIAKKASLFFVLLVAAAQVTWGQLYGSFATYELIPAKLIASSVYPKQAGFSYEPEHLIDNKDVTAWFHAKGDTDPWVEFTFDREVILTELYVENGLLLDQANWRANSRAKGIRVELSDGTSAADTLQDISVYKMYAPKGIAIPTRSVRIRFIGSYPSQSPEVGLSELHLYGRYNAPGDAQLGDLKGCTITVTRDLNIPAARTTQAERMQSRPFGFDREGVPTVIDLQARARAASQDNRVIRAGRSFPIDSIQNKAEGLFFSTDAISFVLSYNRKSCYEGMKQNTLTDLNVLFAGWLEFSAPVKKDTRDF